MLANIAFFADTGKKTPKNPIFWVVPGFIFLYATFVKTLPNLPSRGQEFKWATEMNLYKSRIRDELIKENNKKIIIRRTKKTSKYEYGSLSQPSR
jgi:hypothetical protein